MADSLAEDCVYTTHNSPDLERIIASGGVGELTESTYWRGGSEILRRADAAGERVAVLLSAAESKEMKIAYWALLTDVDPSESDERGRRSTTYSFERLTRIDPVKKSELHLINTGKRLSDDFIRPYSLCKTPSFLSL
jgi:hypothetical protein